VEFNCAHCGTLASKATGHVNRARAQGLRLFCSKACSGLARRKGKTLEQRKEEKRIYDAEYRLRDPDGLKARKAAYYQLTHDPVKEAEKRRKIMPRHVEYCRRPEYLEWKRAYDQQYRDNKLYGEFAECFRLVLDIRGECLSRMSDYEIRLEKGTTSKTQKRKRDHERSIRNGFEIGPLGNLERGERGQNGCRSRGRDRLPSPRNPTDYEHSASDLAAGQTTGRG